MKNILLLTFLSVLQSTGLTVSMSPYLPFPQSSVLQFYREDILFKLNETAMETDAIYHFCNVGDKGITTQLFYPFPENTMELIDSLCVKNDITGEILQYREGKDGVFFGISVKAYGQAAYRVFFRQQLKERHYKYILTSTESWNRALEFANFELRAPTGLTIASFSYPADTSYIKDTLQYFFWKKKDFMPARDFEVYFH